MIPYGRRLKYAFRTFVSILDFSRIPDDVVGAMVTTEARPRAEPVAPPPAPMDSSDRALQMLAPSTST